MNKMEQQELISALADGQFQGQALARAVEAVASDADASQAWRTYHLIGEVLRSGQVALGTPGAAFLSRLQSRLRLEAPPSLAQQAPITTSPQVLAARSGSSSGVQPPAANDASFRWKLVAGLASVAAVTAVGWTLIGQLSSQPLQSQLAGTPPAAQSGAVLAGGGREVMIRDRRLDELLEAHRQLGGATALQMPAGFLRNATFEGSSR